MYQKNKISVITLTKDRPLLLSKCLDRIFHQQVPADEIIIIDSSKIPSIDPKNISSSISIQYRHIPNCSIPAARNTGIQLSRNNLLLFVDDDCLIQPDAIKILLGLLSKHPKIQLIIGNLTNILQNNPYAQIQDYFHMIWMRENFTGKKELEKFSSGVILHFDLLFVRKKFIRNAFFDLSAPSFFQDDDIDIGNQLYSVDKNMFLSNQITTYYYPRNKALPLCLRNFYTGFSNHYIFSKKNIDVKRTVHTVSNSVKKEILFSSLKKLTARKNKLIFLILLVISPICYKLGWLYYPFYKMFNYKKYENSVSP